MTDLSRLLEEVVPVVRAAGRHVAARGAAHVLDRSVLQVQVKEHDSDFVTAVDREVEERIVAFLRRRFPDTGVLAEEGSSHNPGAGRLWVLDPLDGTRNFIKGHPGYNVSLGLVQDGWPVLGVVYDIE